MSYLDNRDSGSMYEYLEASIDCLRRENELLRQGAIPLSEAMICLNCSKILRVGQSCCGDVSLLSAWLSGVSA